MAIKTAKGKLTIEFPSCKAPRFGVLHEGKGR